MFHGVAERCLSHLETLFLNEINGLSRCLETLCNAMETLSIQFQDVAKIVTPPLKGGGTFATVGCNG